MQDVTQESAEMKELRLGLAAWVGRVASFQQVEVFHVLHQWFQHASTEEVSQALTDLMKQDPSAGWSTCAVEDETCECPSGRIRYGHVEKRWLEKKDVKKLYCSLGTFGGNDVAVGMLKSCQCWLPIEPGAASRDLKETAASLSSEGSLASSIWSALTSSESSAAAAAVPLGVAPTGSSGAGVAAAAGSLWHRMRGVETWIATIATPQQLEVIGQVYKWLENTRDGAKIATAVSKAAAHMMARKVPMCPDGQPVDAALCPGFAGQYFCRAGCLRQAPLAAAKASDRTPSSLPPRGSLCAAGAALELLWSCDEGMSRRPAAGHQHAAKAQHVLDASVAAMCEEPHMRDLMTVYLECDFLQSYLRWTSDDSEWLEEAFVTYVGGSKGSTYEWQATNLVRSVDVFSSRPIVVVVFGNEFVPPVHWHGMPNLIVYRMKPIAKMVSFNFNKMRSMISARVAVGIQLDTDQLVAPGIDQLFEGTRREITEHYPWPMMPVHWMSREGKKPDPYWEYAFRDWAGPRSMRWGHAHPTWSFWALPFLCDMLHERLAASSREPGASIMAWKLQSAPKRGVLAILADGKAAREPRAAKPQGFMREDEDMLNVALWRDGVRKDWCKFDLEWGLFKDGQKLDRNLYWDKKWYPDGMPVVFISMHNTKQFESTDWLLSLLAKCDRERPKLSCPSRDLPRYCQAGSSDERRWRKQPSKYAETICCCLEPRQETKIYWAGQWFRNAADVPLKIPQVKKDRTCVLP